jgi:hypothetical protein
MCVELAYERESASNNVMDPKTVYQVMVAFDEIRSYVYVRADNPTASLCEQTLGIRNPMWGSLLPKNCVCQLRPTFGRSRYSSVSRRYTTAIDALHGVS